MAAVALHIRRRIIAGHDAGQSLTALAREFHVSYHTVQTLCQRVASQGEAGLAPRYDRCARHGLRRDPLLYRAACWLKRRHPAWGAPLIRLLLVERYPALRVPAVRTLQVWFKANRLNVARSSVPKPEKQWATRVHQIWQVDAKEQQHTADGTPCCWLTITDEHSTAILDAPVFSLGTDHSRAPEAGAAGTHHAVRAVGTARGDQGRQWPTVWRSGQRSDSGHGAVADRHRHRGHLEPSAPAH